MIIRTEKTKNYTVMANHALNDSKLSLKACGMWAWLMSKPDNWEISINGIFSQRIEGRDAIRSALDELETAGYLTRGQQVRNEDGTFSTSPSILHETPTVLENPTSDNPIQVNTDIVNTNIGAKAPMKIDKRNPEVQELMDSWVESFAGNNGGVNARRFATLLIKSRGLDRAKGAILAARSVVTEQFAPSITSVQDLYYKWDKLEVFFARRGGEQSKRSVTITE